MKRAPGGMSISVLLAWILLSCAFAAAIYLQFPFKQIPDANGVLENRLLNVEKKREQQAVQLEGLRNELESLKRQLPAATARPAKGKRR